MKVESMRLRGLAQSDIRRMTRECALHEGINLAQGNCQLPTPDLVQDAAIEALHAQKNTYTFPEGAPDVREAIAEKLRRHNGIEADPDSEIVVTCGATGGYSTTLFGLLAPGDGIVLFEPYYGYHYNTAVAAGLEPQLLTLEPPEFHLAEEALRSAVRPNTRAVVLCSPSNPSGKMLTQAELEGVARVAEEHDLLIITDEVYEYIRYDDRQHISPASLDAFRERTVTLMSLSKTYSVTGWRLGYVYAPAEMAQRITLANDLFYVCAPRPLMHGVVAGLRAPDSFYEEMRRNYARKRDMLLDALEEVGLNPIRPEGAYYILADISHLGYSSSLEAAMSLLETGKVAAVPGTAFYQGPIGEKLLRFCFALEDDVLEQACDNLQQFRLAHT